jgi:hypothetical protein
MPAQAKRPRYATACNRNAGILDLPENLRPASLHLFARRT